VFAEMRMMYRTLTQSGMTEPRLKRHVKEN
jgi:hypothetical protein